MESTESQKYWNLNLTLVITFLVFLVFSLIQIIVLFFVSGGLNIDNQLIIYSNVGLISSLSSLVGCSVIYFFIKIKKHTLQQYLNLHQPSLKLSILIIIASFILMGFIEYISNLYPNQFYSSFVVESYKNSNSLMIFYLGVVCLGPLFEELLFRGFLFKGLERSFIGGVGAIWVTSILFVLVHIQYSLYILICIVFPLALLLGYARYKSGSLLLPLLIHVINNLITCLVTHFEVY